MRKQIVCVTGKDDRQDYVAQYLCDHGLRVRRREEFTLEGIQGASMIIGPVAYYSDGGFLPELQAACQREGVTTFNYMESEEFLLQNAYLTAEGFLSILIQNTPFSLVGARILLLGLGRCGREIKKILEKFSCTLMSYDKVPDLSKEPKLSIELATCQVVINTIPAKVIGEALLYALPGDCRLFDLATAPGGYDEKVVGAIGLTLQKCPGIPGKYLPKSAGAAIGKSAMRHIIEKENEGKAEK
ncbi:hypothetical protein LJC58_10220, partial [Lachnospiraceae bacterium OttesenSCG-928-D06]|nr:hypothetical protein [Lachnospiraceae bacterium OttesenSCG-928-D06]